MAGIRVQCALPERAVQSSHQLRRTAAVPASEQTVSRRNAIQKLAVIPVLAPMVQAILPQQALAAEAAPETASPPAPPPAAKYKSFIARDFMLRYPDTFKIVEDSDSYIPNATARPKESPVRVELQSPDGKGRVTVVQQQVAKVKQTLFQVTDVTQLGSPQDVARLLLPPASTVVSAQVITIPQAPKDTGTVLGVIERPPIQQYRYEVVLRDGQRAEVAVGVILGRVLLLGAVAPEAEWELQRETLRGIADSFKLLPK